MKNRILIAGCSLYEREYKRNGAFYVSREFYIHKLYNTYSVDNLSKKTLTSRQALLLIKAFTNLESYDLCVISLGEGDSLIETPLQDFRSNIKEILDELNKKGIKAVLQNPVRGEGISGYQRVVKELREEYKIKNYIEATVA